MALEPLHADSGGAGSTGTGTGSVLLLALSRDPMASSSGCLLDLVEVISVDSSDEEDGPVVAMPLQLVHVKQETDESGVVKYELCALESTENDVVDLCSDDDGDDDDGAVGDRGDRVVGGKQPEIATRFVYEHAHRRVGAGKQLNGSSTTTIRFKRQKIRYEPTANAGSAPGSRDTTASSSSESGSEFAFSDNGDDDFSASDDFDEDDDDDAADDASEVEGLLGTRGGRRCSALPHQRPLLRHPTPSSSCNLTREQVDKIILRDVRLLEEKKPWRHVYRCLGVPFSVNRTIDAFDLLFERWDSFWSQYGRAVWERYFWAPLKPGTIEYHRRKHRQSRAMRTFRSLARDLCKKLGPDFLRKLTRTAHDGWWCRSDPLVLRELFYLDRRKYAMYMTLHRERFPRGSRFERSLDPAWCLDTEFTGGGGVCGGIGGGAACLAWQDVTKSDDEDDECGSECD